MSIRLRRSVAAAALFATPVLGLAQDAIKAGCLNRARPV